MDFDKRLEWTPIMNGSRNQELIRAAGRLKSMAHDGDISFSDALERLAEQNETRCRPPVTEQELLGIWKSSLRMG